ncbi:carbon starvation CstA family protein [Bythopirellula goksoeyrii]|uniref:Carbon starvation protein A n=1 Tax=Bythopirellula goksoeyrii TaxID=1400387 RepID=A0A5B9QKA4_9BACT|nr:carbon starvation protein A [Bythopirellula goksoeyrii]QEG34533.1 Carbon starvation protein A [Bythopirellula goksoeyrii]
MDTLLVALGSFLGFIIAYNTYGRWLARKVFGVDPQAVVPSQELRDDVDFVPTRRSVIFGHHFTSIAGTGPIVGPAIAVFWGWLPALLWVVFGSIFIGAVHDFGALMVSLRNRGQTVGEIAGRLISPRASVIFLLILFFALTVVLAVFGQVIASIFSIYPQSVLSVWLSLPLAVVIGLWCCRHGGNLLLPSLGALGLLYLGVVVGADSLPINLQQWLPDVADHPLVGNSTVVWTAILFVYCFFASVLPVWLLLQPRDYINSLQLVVALLLLLCGMFAAGLSGHAGLVASAPAVAKEIPAGAPPIWPFLFITIACGAISGFHCLVSSGTTSKQVASESDALSVGYGSMLLEGALAVLVILACCAGVGMGKFDRQTDGTYQVAVNSAGSPILGSDAWHLRYDSSGSWSNFRLGQMVGAFVDGGANFLSALGIAQRYAIALIAMLVACFAATTLDTATRLQRYVVQELAGVVKFPPLANKYVATTIAVGSALGLALMRGPSAPGGPPAPYGTGGQYLWPLFGATNQLLAGLAFMVTVFYLARRNKPVWFIVLPMVMMIIMPLWALLWNMFNPSSGWWQQGNYLLFSVGTVTILLQIWMVAEALLAWPKAKGTLEEALPPLQLRGIGSASG